jgi:tetratricopeptide (TPR) repeat protein
MRGRPTDEPDKVDFLLVLALRGHRDRLVDAGRRSEALAVTGEVVDLYRRMVAEDPDMLGDLPGELDIYSDRLRDVGRHADAEAVYVEIVQIFRDLVATEGEPWMRLGVVAALINSGGCLSRIGRYDEALARSTEAATLARSLIEADRGEAESSLATALNNASVDLIRLHRYEEAVDAATEAVQIRRRLAASDPADHGPGLAMALNTLAEALSGFGRYAEAVAASAEAFDRYRRIVAAGALDDDGAWADCLETFAAVRLAAGVELAEALRAAEESIAVYERLRDEPRFENRLDDAVRTRVALLALDG